MRRVILLLASTSTLLALSGCPAKPKNGECKSSKDCEMQQGYGKVCIDGRCQECGADADCQAGFVCRANQCVPKPQCQDDADCPAGQSCQGERCAPKTSDKSSRAPETAKSEVPGECADPSAFVIHFGFDQATLTGDSQGRLQKLSDCLKQAPAKKLLIEGHCDERGTTQYNIALGSRRAESARKYLADLGVSSKLDTVSFGKEKPVCSDASEDCWAKNRRDEFEAKR